MSNINFLLKRSNVASKRPTAAQLDIGELSLNYDQGTSGLFFEDSTGAVRKIGPVEVSGTAPNSSPAGSGGNSLGELWYDSGTSTLKIFDGSSFVSTGGGGTGSDFAQSIKVVTSNVTIPTTAGFNQVAFISLDVASGATLTVANNEVFTIYP